MQIISRIIKKKVAINWQNVTGNVLSVGYGLSETSPAACIDPVISTNVQWKNSPGPAEARRKGRFYAVLVMKRKNCPECEAAPKCFVLGIKNSVAPGPYQPQTLVSLIPDYRLKGQITLITAFQGQLYDKVAELHVFHSGIYGPTRRNPRHQGPNQTVEELKVSAQ